MVILMQVQEYDQLVAITIENDQCGTLWKTIEPYLSAGKKGVVLDLSQVGYLNSVSIASIIGARNKTSTAGKKMVVANLRDSIKSIFRVLKLERLFDLDLNYDKAAELVCK